MLVQSIERTGEESFVRCRAGQCLLMMSEQPTDEERELIAQWILDDALKVDCAGPERPGRVTIQATKQARVRQHDS